MSSGRNATLVVALVALGAGLSWVIVNRAQQGPGADTIPDTVEVPQAAEPEPPISGTPVASDSEAAAGVVDGAPVVAVPPGPDAWPAKTLEFAKQADPDPTLSRHLETELQKLIDSTLDRARFEAESVTCRGNRCQVLTLDREAVAGPPATAFIGSIFRGLSDAGIRSPTNGSELKPNLEMMLKRGNAPARVEFIVAFVNP